MICKVKRRVVSGPARQLLRCKYNHFMRIEQGLNFKATSICKVVLPVHGCIFILFRIAKLNEYYEFMLFIMCLHYVHVPLLKINDIRCSILPNLDNLGAPIGITCIVPWKESVQSPGSCCLVWWMWSPGSSYPHMDGLCTQQWLPPPSLTSRRPEVL